MDSSVLFVVNGFSSDNIQLQPWRYVYELAKHKSKTSDVFILTNGGTDYKEIDLDEHIKIIETNVLSITRQTKLLELISSINPSELWWSTTQRSIAYYPLLSRIKCRKIAFITCPIYKWSELLKATLSGIPYELTKALWSQRVVPRLLFKLLLNSKTISKIAVQSSNNKSILQGYGVNPNKINLIPVGIDSDDDKPIKQDDFMQVSDTLNRDGDEVVFLYLGAARPIRGFDSLLKAFPAVANKNDNARLVVLARGASQEQCDHITSELKKTGSDKNITLVSGWLTKEQVLSYLELSDVVVLPFILVPSDIPVAALEALARGKPIVVSQADGLPELAEKRGIIVDPLDKNKFADELYKLSTNRQQVELYADAARKFISNYPRWQDVGSIVDNVCNNEADNKT